MRADARDWTWPLVALLLAWGVLFAPLLFRGEHVAFGDAATFRPFPAYSRALWRDAHARTHWNPYVFMGLESVASLADSRPQYLPDALLALAERLHEPRFAPQLWLLLLHLAGALAVMILARRLWVAPPWAAAAGALAWLLALPILGPFGHGFDAMLVSTALLPIAVLATHWTLALPRERDVLAAALLLVIALGVSALHGHPQVLVYTGMLLPAFAVQQAVVLGRWRRVPLWAGAVALAVAIGASVWWPALLYSGVSSRGGLGAPQIPVEALARYSLAARDLASLVWPHAVGFGHGTYWGGLHLTDFPPYLGAVGAVLLLLGAGAAHVRAVRAHFWWIVLGLAVLLSLGTSLGPSYVALQRLVPLWDRFRAPSYTMLVACLAFALLVARGVAVALASPPRRSPVALGLLALAAGVGLLIAAGPLAGAYEALALATRPGLAPAAAHVAATRAGWDLFLRTMLVAGVLAALTVPRSRRHAGPVVAALVALDLGAAVLPEFGTYVGPASLVAPPAPTLLARSAVDPHARVYVGAAQPVRDASVAMGRYAEPYTNAWSDWRVRCLTGNHGAFPAGWTLVMELGMTRSAAVLSAWGVSLFDVDRNAPPLDIPPIAEDTRSRVYPLRGALGRLYAVPQVTALPDEPTVARVMMSPAFDPTVEAVTTDASIGGRYPGAATTRFRWVEDGPERVAVDVEANEPTFVVLADSHQPGWSAHIDGHPARHARVDLLVRGVAVPAGTHRIEWSYATPGRAGGVAVTRAALALWALLSLALGVAALSLSRRRAGLRPASGPPATAAARATSSPGSAGSGA